MNTGEQVLEYLYHTQLQVDDRWSVRTEKGFTWWPHRHAQTIEVVGVEPSPDGDHDYLVSIRTSLLRKVDLRDVYLGPINDVLSGAASMAGPVYDADAGTLSLCSLVRVHNAIVGWMNPLLSIAAVLQIAEAKAEGPGLAQALRAKEDLTGHPVNGLRRMPDEMAGVVDKVVVSTGWGPSRWPAQEFEELEKYVQGPAYLDGDPAERHINVRLTYGEGSSFFMVAGDDYPHSRYGSGLFLLQQFRAGAMSPAWGHRLALALNGVELAVTPAGYGFGSYLFRDGDICFGSFLPNLAYKPGLLPNLYFAAAGRARAMPSLLERCYLDPALAWARLSPRSAGRL